jgi:hypothetical protein
MALFKLMALQLMSLRPRPLALKYQMKSADGSQRIQGPVRYPIYGMFEVSGACYQGAPVLGNHSYFKGRAYDASNLYTTQVITPPSLMGISHVDLSTILR